MLLSKKGKGIQAILNNTRCSAELWKAAKTIKEISNKISAALKSPKLQNLLMMQFSSLLIYAPLYIVSDFLDSFAIFKVQNVVEKFKLRKEMTEYLLNSSSIIQMSFDRFNARI